MKTRLPTKARERTSYVVRASFTDEEGRPVKPDSLNWSLVDSNGGTVNGRESVEVRSPSCTENIVLAADDLALGRGRSREMRAIVFRGKFWSPLAGELLSFEQQSTFLVEADGLNHPAFQES